MIRKEIKLKYVHRLIIAHEQVLHRILLGKPKIKPPRNSKKTFQVTESWGILWDFSTKIFYDCVEILAPRYCVENSQGLVSYHGRQSVDNLTRWIG